MTSSDHRIIGSRETPAPQDLHSLIYREIQSDATGCHRPPQVIKLPAPGNPSGYHRPPQDVPSSISGFPGDSSPSGSQLHSSNHRVIESEELGGRAAAFKFILPTLYGPVWDPHPIFFYIFPKVLTATALSLAPPPILMHPTTRVAPDPKIGKIRTK